MQFLSWFNNHNQGKIGDKMHKVFLSRILLYMSWLRQWGCQAVFECLPMGEKSCKQWRHERKLRVCYTFGIHLTWVIGPWSRARPSCQCRFDMKPCTSSVLVPILKTSTSSVLVPIQYEAVHVLRVSADSEAVHVLRVSADSTEIGFDKLCSSKRIIDLYNY